MRNIWHRNAVLYHLSDILLIIGVMIIGMAIAATYGYEIWHGALVGLIVHRIVRIILRNLRNYIYGGRN